MHPTNKIYVTLKTEAAAVISKGIARISVCKEYSTSFRNCIHCPECGMKDTTT